MTGVLAEVLPREARRVAEAGRRLGGEVQQQPRVLDPAAAERVGAGAEREAGVAGLVAAETGVLDRGERRVEAEVGEIGVDDERDAGGSVELGRVLVSKVGGGSSSGTGRW